MADRGRTIMYFDNSNIFKAQIRAGWRIDAKKFVAKLEESGPIWQTYFVASVSDPPRYQQTNFYRMLKNELRWETIIFPLGRKTTECKKCGSKWTSFAEKGVDVAIATKLLTHAVSRAFDTAILVSGDRDYLDTVRTVKTHGLRVEVVSFRASLSKELADESSIPTLILDDIRSQIELAAPDQEAESMQVTDGDSSSASG